MKLTEAVKLLKHHQEWRLGADINGLHPTQITEAIDVILNNYKNVYTKHEFLDAAKLGEVNMHDAKHIVSLLDEVRELNKNK